MADLSALRRAQMLAAEKAVIDSIPSDLKALMDKAQAKHEAKGGCPGCGHKVLACHYGNCPTLNEPDYY